jgi:hypothetical protein
MFGFLKKKGAKRGTKKCGSGKKRVCRCVKVKKSTKRSKKSK